MIYCPIFFFVKPEAVPFFIQIVIKQDILVPILLVMLLLVTGLLVLIVNLRAREKKRFIDLSERYLAELEKSRARSEESDRKCRQMLDHLKEGMILTNESGIVLFANARACHFAGVPYEKLIHQPLPAWLWNDISNFSKVFRKIKIGSAVSEKVQVTRGDTSLWLELTYSWHPTPESEPGAALTIADVTAQVALDEKVKQLTTENNEKNKQINCLFDISDISGVPNITFDEIIERSLQIIPNGLKFSHDTWVEIIFEDKRFCSANFRETPWSYTAPIKIRRKKLGELRVGYAREKPRNVRDAFHLNEKLLIKNIAERLGQILELVNLEKQLGEQSEKSRTASVNRKK